MAAVCVTPFKLPACRFTLLSNCGVPVVGNASTVSTTGIISVAETKNMEDQEEFYEKNGDGQFCVQDQTAPIYKYSDVVITICTTDPEMINLATAEAIVVDDSTTPQSIGYNTSEGSAALANFAFEGWTRLTNKTNCTTGFQYGYVVYPWMINGMIDDQTFENGILNMVIKARTRNSSPWGVGPYNVAVSNAATLTTGQPIPLLTPILANQHRRWQLTALPFPPSSCGGSPLTFALPVITKVGLVATLTFPTPTNLPAIINWGDGTADSTVTVGTSTTHTYIAGTYQVTYNPTAYSRAPYTGSITVP